MKTYNVEIRHEAIRTYEITVPDGLDETDVEGWLDMHADEVYQERDTDWDLDSDMDGEIAKDGPVNIKIKQTGDDGNYEVEAFGSAE